MSALAWTVAAPLLAGLWIVIARRAVAPAALAGAVASLGAGALVAVRVFHDGAYGLAWPWLGAWPLSLHATPTTALLALIVASVSSLVLVFAIGYMRGDEGRVRFFALLSLFVAAMQTLVLAGDWILFLAAWELIGFCSYVLIGHWYGRDGVPSAATRAFLYTRSADIGLFIAVFVLLTRTGSSDIATTIAAGPLATGVGLLLLLAAMGKSAQVPLQGWLQVAMLGPTPVSALLHSATLVAAGAILLLRALPLLDGTVLLCVALAGGITTVVAGLMALAATDLKRLLAASTSSQYGLILLAIGAGYPSAALVHLLAHAVIKSGLFLQAGAFQKTFDTTELARLQGTARARRALGVAFVLSSLALIGTPPLSGMFSKDALIAAALGSTRPGLFGALTLAGIGLGGAYVGRALRVLWGRADTVARPSPRGWMAAGIAGLTALAVLGGPALEPLARWSQGELPKSHLALVVGLGTAALGLAWGVLLHSPLPAAVRPWANRGFVVNGGWYGTLALPVSALAERCERADRALHGLVLGVARGGALLARATRISDERGIDGFIAWMLHVLRGAARTARGLQTGLVHRELLWAAGGTGVALLLMMVLAV